VLVDNNSNFLPLMHRTHVNITRIEQHNVGRKQETQLSLTNRPTLVFVFCIMCCPLVKSH